MADENRQENEKATVTFMIGLYCRKNHGSPKGSLCTECSELKDYACDRVDKCHFQGRKPFCSHCPIHCYKEEMREKIRTVMRYSGPRMIMYHPVMAIKHVLAVKKDKKELE